MITKPIFTSKLEITLRSRRFAIYIIFYEKKLRTIFSFLNKKKEGRKKYPMCNSFEQIFVLLKIKFQLPPRVSWPDTRWVTHPIKLIAPKQTDLPPSRSIELFFYANTRERNFHKQHSSTYRSKGSLVGITNCLLSSVEFFSATKIERGEKKGEKARRKIMGDLRFSTTVPSFRWYNRAVRGRLRANSPRNGRPNGDRMGFGELGPGNGADR